MKRLLSLVLSLALILTFAPTALAASDEAITAANALYELGLFSGTGTDSNGNPIFELDRAPTRHEAVTMLVRLLGKESEAKAGSWSIPFVDVAEWAVPYVGYAYTNGLTAGISDKIFGGNYKMTAPQYLTLVLRSLGYESGTDFQWNKAWELSDKIGLTDGRYNASTTTFLRGDVAIISYQALQTSSKYASIPLLQSLINSGLIAQKVPSVQKNNIPLNKIEEILNHYLNATTTIKLMEKLVERIFAALASGQTENLEADTSAFCIAALGMISEFDKMYNSCGSYDDTINLKKHLYDIKIAFQNLGSISSQDILTNTLTDNNSFIEEYGNIYNSLANKGTFDMIQEELRPFSEIYKSSTKD